MKNTATNSYRVFKKLKEAEIPEAQAEAIAMTFYELDVSLMKKMSDMLDAKFAGIDAKFTSQETLLDTKLDAKFADIDAKYALGISELKVELHSTLRVHLYAIIAMFIGLGVFSKFFPV